jgi:SWI/SNF-related matrix-associated actin-dependent regulator 1 of chromatin subfamily A
MRKVKLDFDKCVFEYSYNKKINEELKELDFIYRYYDKSWEKRVDEISAIKINRLIKKFNFTLDSSLSKISLFKPYFDVPDFTEKIDEYLKRYFIDQESKDYFSCLFKFIPREYQWIAAIFIIDQEKCIIGDDVGIGKTFESLMAIEMAALHPCLIICPASLKYRWRNEIYNSINKETDVQIIDDGIRSADYFIINYDRLDKHEEELKDMGFASVIMDESQYVKKSTTKRSKAARKITKDINYKILLSGTMVTNKVIDIWNQIMLVNRADNFGNWKKFIYRYCGAHKTQYGYDLSGATNVPELSLKLRTSFYLRREKAEVMKDLPKKQTVIINVDLTNKKDYDFAEEEFIEFLSLNFNQMKVDNAMRAQAIVKQNYLRQLSSEGKLKNTKEWIDNFLESTDEKLLVFCVFKKTIDELKDHYKCKKIDGSVKSEDRQKYLDEFVEGKERILFMNIKTGGTGLDGIQKACSTVLFIDLPEIPTELEQAEGRIYRSGQKEPVISYVMVANESIDEKILDMLDNKLKITDGINKGKFNHKDKRLKTNLIEYYL